MKPDFVVTDLVPHAGEMLLIDSVEDYEIDRLCSRYVVPERTPFSTEVGDFPAWVFVEIMAQSIAAHVGVRCRLAGLPVPMGFLVGTRQLMSSVASVPHGTVLNIVVEPLVRAGDGLGLWSCVITAPDVLVEARLSVYEPPDVDAFFAQGAP